MKNTKILLSLTTLIIVIVFLVVFLYPFKQWSNEKQTEATSVTDIKQLLTDELIPFDTLSESKKSILINYYNDVYNSISLGTEDDFLVQWTIHTMTNFCEIGFFDESIDEMKRRSKVVSDNVRDAMTIINQKVTKEMKKECLAKKQEGFKQCRTIALDFLDPIEKVRIKTKVLDDMRKENKTLQELGNEFLHDIARNICGPITELEQIESVVFSMAAMKNMSVKEMEKTINLYQNTCIERIGLIKDDPEILYIDQSPKMLGAIYGSALPVCMFTFNETPEECLAGMYQSVHVTIGANNYKKIKPADTYETFDKSEVFPDIDRLSIEDYFQLSQKKNKNDGEH